MEMQQQLGVCDHLLIPRRDDDCSLVQVIEPAPLEITTDTRLVLENGRGTAVSGQLSAILISGRDCVCVCWWTATKRVD